MSTASPADAPRQVPAPAGYSPPLTITLELAGRSLDVAVAGPGFVKLRNPAWADAGDALLHFKVGEQTETQRVTLPDGLRGDQPRQAIRVRPPAEAAAVA